VAVLWVALIYCSKQWHNISPKRAKFCIENNLAVCILMNKIKFNLCKLLQVIFVAEFNALWRDIVPLL
jgi:hypothetical protein